MQKNEPCPGAVANLFRGLPTQSASEVLDDLLRAPGVRIERIVSTGQSTPPGVWLAQDWTEWVILLNGASGLQFETEAEVRILKPGDWITIPPGVKHRVAWTSVIEPTVWLAVHIGEPTSAP
jgi:cupin 2 domain-containing protein